MVYYWHQPERNNMYLSDMRGIEHTPDNDGTEARALCGYNLPLHWAFVRDFLTGDCPDCADAEKII